MSTASSIKKRKEGKTKALPLNHHGHRSRSAMEMIAILAAIPAAAFAIAWYQTFLNKFILSRDRLKIWFVAFSYLVLTGLVIELFLLRQFGVVVARGLLGPGFLVGHTIIFFLGSPALANLLVLRRRLLVLSEGAIVIPICTALAFGLLVLNIDVSEKLCGINGDGERYCRLITGSESAALRHSATQIESFAV